MLCIEIHHQPTKLTVPTYPISLPQLPQAYHDRTTEPYRPTALTVPLNPMPTIAPYARSDPSSPGAITWSPGSSIRNLSTAYSYFRTAYMHHTLSQYRSPSTTRCLSTAFHNGTINGCNTTINGQNAGINRCNATINGCNATINGCNAAINGCNATINGCSTFLYGVHAAVTEATER
eukprot:3514334-Rhodomonas_salina.1